MGYRHVMVCLDLRSTKAAHLLARASEQVGTPARLSAVTVLEVGSFDDEQETVASMIEQEYSARTAQLERICRSAGCSQADQRVLVGQAPAQIAIYARDQECDLVVLGEHEDRPERRGLGSTADAILRLVSCDALVIRRPTVAR